MNLREINRGAVALVLLLMLGAGGYLWYSMMYVPAVESRTAAETSATTAEQGLSAANDELDAAQKRLAEALSETSTPDDAVGRLALAAAGIPTKKRIDDAAIVLASMAKRAGVDTRYKAGELATFDDSGIGYAGTDGEEGIHLRFDGAGRYTEIMEFMRLIESNVNVKDDKIFARGRLFNVVLLKVGDDLENPDEYDIADVEDPDYIPLRSKDHMYFRVIVRMYTSSSENAVTVGSAPADPAAVGAAEGGQTLDANGAPVDPGAATEQPPAEGAAADPNAAPADPNAPQDKAPSADTVVTPSPDGAGSGGA